MIFGMSRAPAVQLPEAFEIVQSDGEFTGGLILGIHCFDTGQMQDGVEKGGGVACGKDKSIAIRPEGVGRIIAQEFLVQNIHHWRHGHRCAGVARIRLLHGIHAESANGVDGQDFEFVLVHKFQLALYR